MGSLIPCTLPTYHRRVNIAVGEQRVTRASTSFGVRNSNRVGIQVSLYGNVYFEKRTVKLVLGREAECKLEKVQ